MTFRWTFWSTMVAAAVLAAGCSKKAASETGTSQEVRGEAINEKPAAAATEPAKPTPTTETAAVPAVASEAPTVATSVPSPAPAPAPAQPTAPATQTEGDFAEIGFEFLSGFNYEMPDESSVSTNAPAPSPKEQIPPNVKALDKKRIALKGFMLPLKVEGGLITELLIMRDQSMCCYGTVPRINEWVSVKMVGKGVKPVMDQAITLYGALKVGEMYENGYLVGIYQLDGEKMAGPLDL